MRVFELRYPGVWLQGLDDETWTAVNGLCHALEGHLADAAVGLHLFEMAQAAPQEPPGWKRRAEAVRVIRDRMERDLPVDLTREQRWVAERDIMSLAADLEARRQQWAAGLLPDSYIRQLPFIHARTVLYALDGIGKTLRVLGNIGDLPDGVRNASSEYEFALPDLFKVRNSAHHTEDRIRGLGRNQQALMLQPIDLPPNINAPLGTVLVVSSLRGNLLGYTAADGHFREVAISAASVTAAQDAIQKVLDALTWKGPVRVTPD